MSNSKTPTANIIGAGPGGLACAMLLAHRGMHVRVFERMPVAGGRCSAITQQGFRFDTGPTFFLYPRVLADVFNEIGRDMWKEIEFTKLDPQYRIAFGAGGKIDASADVEHMEQEIAAINPGDAGQFQRFLDDNRDKLERFRPILESPFLSMADLMSPSMLQALPKLRPWLSLAGDLRRYFSDPRLLVAFSFQSKYLGMSPFQCPSLFSILAFLEYEYGVYHPTGGCSAVSEKMATIAAEMGVEFYFDTPVESIQFEGRRATGVSTRHGDFENDVLVINADFANAMQTLVPDSLRRRWTDRKIERKKFSCSTFMMYLGIRGVYEELKHHTIYISADYEQNLRDIEQNHVLPNDPSVYLQNASVTDPSLAPEGHSTLYVLAPVSQHTKRIDWELQKAAFREQIIGQLEKIGVHNLRDRIVFEKVVTPADWHQQHRIHLGATFNLAHNLGQMLHLRPRNKFEDLDGVYLVGGGTHPGSGLPVIYESARITSRLIAKEFGLQSSGGPQPGEPDSPPRAA